MPIFGGLRVVWGVGGWYLSVVDNYRHPITKNQQENKKKTQICKKLKSGTNDSFLSIIGSTDGDYARGITVVYQ